MSLLTIAAYWGWFFYLKFIVRESEANKEVKLGVEIEKRQAEVTVSSLSDGRHRLDGKPSLRGAGPTNPSTLQSNV